jgi:hypothetical protein
LRLTALAALRFVVAALRFVAVVARFAFAGALLRLPVALRLGVVGIV